MTLTWTQILSACVRRGHRPFSERGKGLYMIKKGFTLIELLIVVAIIAILAAIAVPNFLEAQVRSKVSSMKSNLRTVNTALEAYMVDNNRYPQPTYTGINGSWTPEQRWKFFPGSLTTPVAFLTGNTAMTDIFRAKHNFSTEIANEIMYLPSLFYKPPFSADDSSYGPQCNRYGLWVIRSAGPDTWYQNQPGVNGDYDASNPWNKASYDPTNGTVSAGDIYRSQKSSDESHT